MKNSEESAYENNSDCQPKRRCGQNDDRCNLGVALADMGYKVLLVDADPQASLSRYLGCSQGNEGASLKELIEAACNEVDPPDVVIHTDEKVDVIPANIQLLICSEV